MGSGFFSVCLLFCFYLFSPLPESNHNVYLDLLFLAHVFIIVCLYPRPAGTMDQTLLPLGTSAKITFYNEEELRNIHCVPLTDGPRQLRYSEKEFIDLLAHLLFIVTSTPLMTFHDV